MNERDIKPATALSAHDLAGLHLKFVVPLVVGDMLQGREALDDVAEYTLHDVMGAFEPDTALLCLALCAQNVAAHVAHMPSARMLGVQADRIAEEYGPVWLAYEAGMEGPNEDELRRMLDHIPEDLESLGDLMLATCGELDQDHAIAAILCDILSQQAYMHKELAEARVDSLRLTTEPAAKTPDPRGANIVQFPVPTLG